MTLSSFYPEPAGGMELGVLALAKQLTQKGVDVTVAAPVAEAFTEHSYDWQGIAVRRFLSCMRQGDRTVSQRISSLPDFRQVIQEVQPDVITLHSGYAISEASIAKTMAIPIILSIHHVNVLCPRASGMLWGVNPCDLRLETRRCIACRLSTSMPRFVAWPTALLAASCRPPSGFAFHGNLFGLLNAFKLDVVRKLSLLSEVDHFFVQTNWAREALVRNGVLPEMISVSPPCVYRTFTSDEDFRNKSEGRYGPILLGFLGRLKPYKGADLLIDAVKALPAQLPIEVHIHGVIAGDDDQKEYQRLVALAHGDHRIKLLHALSDDKVQAEISNWDAIVCPSRIQDMRPQVILEALALKVPAIGARCGGIRELIQDGRNGLLFEPNDSKDLARAMRRLIDEPDLLARLRSGIQPVPGPEVLGSFTLQVYQSVLSHYCRSGRRALCIAESEKVET